MTDLRYRPAWHDVMNYVHNERNRQIRKWGKQDRHSLELYLTILTEEVGELAAAILCRQFGTDDHPELSWQKEAIQVAAVAMAMVQEKGKL